MRVQSLLILILYSSVRANTIQRQQVEQQISAKNTKIECQNHQNTIHVQNAGLQRLDACICKQGYQWSSIYLECRLTNNESMTSSKLLYLKNNLVVNLPRILTVNCDYTNGFILKNNQCINCRIINNSSGFAENSTSCGCVWPYFWSMQYQICGCYSMSQPAYINNGICIFCSIIANNTIQIDCNNCSGGSFAVSKFGCINCSSIINGVSAQTVNGVRYCICQTGYIYSYLLGTCVCTQYWVQIGSNCSQCSLLHSGLIHECLFCINSFFFNGYYCEFSSTILNFDSISNNCATGYALSLNPANNTYKCSCSASNYFINRSQCLSCFNITWRNSSIFQACKICNQSEGFFSQASQCVYCVSIQFSTGIATVDGCSCNSNYFWNIFTNQCQCDWANGYFQNGNSCANCYNILYTTVSNSSDGCNCMQGYLWNFTTKLCQCSTVGNFLLPTVQGCINCHIIVGSTGNSINGSSCQCYSGYTWDTVQISCICDINQNHYLANGDCIYCQYNQNSNGFASDSGCSCLNGFIFIDNYGGCVCPNSYGAGYVNMGDTCQKCTVAINNLSRTTVDGCINCSMVEGFALFNGVCYACSKQKLTAGTSSVSNGCDCINTTLTWYPSLGSCACSEGYYTSIVNGSFSCSDCGGNCSCGNNITANVSGICIICSTVPYATGNAINNSCICSQGYSWNIKSYPFSCYCSSAAGAFLYGSSCYNCSVLSAYGTITSNGCMKCDVSQGFLYLPVADQCILCSSQSGTDGTATIAGCGCLYGVWNSNSLLCQSFVCNISSCSTCKTNSSCYSCIKGYILSTDSSLCTINCFIAYCDVCSFSNSCSSCITGYQTNSNYTRCVPISCFANCAICSSNSSCFSCFSGYFLSADKTACTIICKVSNCNLCSSSVTCSQCLMGYNLISHSSLCVLNCDDYNCMSCPINSSYCNQCATGLMLTNGTCYQSSCLSNCHICFQNITCLQCNAGYYIQFSLSNISSCVSLCSITNCSECSSTVTCFSCDAGYELTAYNTICKLQCNVSNCDICLTAITCSICLSGYSLNHNYCILECSVGYYNSGNDQNISCASCMAINYTCLTCSYLNASLTCLSCPDNYFLNNASNTCILCNFNNSNCQICTSVTNCTSCTFPYNLNSNGSCERSNCSVANCFACSNLSNFTCEVCVNGFIYNNSTSTCDPNCSVGFIFSEGGCFCPLRTLLNSTNCVPCSDMHCLSCNTTGCLICFIGYYVAQNLYCLSCPYNCANCTSTVCIQCYDGFSLLNNSICSSIGQGINSIQVNNNVAACDFGCSVCMTTNINNQINCTKLQKGYSSSSSIIAKCNNYICRQCTADSSSCLSCFNGYVLLNSSCLACNDPNALSCLSTNLNYSTSCAPGYTTAASISFSGGFCLPCSDNCLKCDINGPSNCDPVECMPGFAQILGTINCTSCFNSCPICDPHNLNICSGCGPYRFMNSQNQCFACQLGCLACNSEIICIACVEGYSLLNDSCYLNVNYPCSGMNGNLKCNACFQGYILNGQTCLIDLTCNANRSCIKCPDQYFLLNQFCLKCPILPEHCLTCDSIDNKCAKCEKGYYISNYNCQPCPNNCKDCSFSTFCNQAATSFYLEINYDGSNTGRVHACSLPCITCVFTSNYCLTCPNGYTISGSTCFSNLMFIVQLVLGPIPYNSTIFNESDSSQSQLTKMLNNVNWLASSFCLILPDSIKLNISSCKGLFRFTSFTIGSIIVNTQINANGVTNASEIQSEISNNLNQIGIGGARIVSFTITFSPSASNINQTFSKKFIILGVCIASGVSFIIVIALIIIIINKRKAMLQTPQTPTSRSQQEAKSSQSDKDNFWKDKILHYVVSSRNLSHIVTKRTPLKKQSEKMEEKQEEYQL